MPLETFTDPERINLKHLSQEVPEQKKVHFEASSITAGWKKMFGNMELDRDTDRLATFLQDYLYIAMVDQERLEPIDEKMWAKIHKYLANPDGHSWDAVLSTKAAIAVLDSSRALEVSPEEMAPIESHLKKNREDGRWDHFAEVSASVVMAVGSARYIEEGDWIGMRKQLAVHHGKGRWKEYAALGANMTIIDSSKTPIISEEDWQQMISLLHKYEFDKYDFFKLAPYAAHLAILQRAEKTESLDQPVAPLPEVRNF